MLQKLLGLINSKIPNTIFQFQFHHSNTKVIIAPKSFIIFLNILPVLILITIMVYECFFHNFILHYVFYYLRVYFIYIKWFTVSEFLHKTNFMLNEIIYERYYEVY